MSKLGNNTRKWSEVLCLTLFLFMPFHLSPLSARAHNVDSVLLDAYRHQNMQVWQTFVNGLEKLPTLNSHMLLYEYGFCGYIADRNPKKAVPYVARFNQHVESSQSSLPKGHYELFKSAVYVYEMKLNLSYHPYKAVKLAREAVQQAPDDPLTLSYYGTVLFYAPKPIGSKQKALKWFELAEEHFPDSQWKYSWVREMNKMYIDQCQEKLKSH